MLSQFSTNPRFSRLVSVSRRFGPKKQMLGNLKETNFLFKRVMSEHNTAWRFVCLARLPCVPERLLLCYPSGGEGGKGEVIGVMVR